MKRVLLLIAFVLNSILSSSQLPGYAQDSSLNNLVHVAGYQTSHYGAIPEYIKAGKGKQVMILIPGLGFDASIFEDFIEANKNNYTMYAITIPGYGNTTAPSMPDTSFSYGSQYWNKGIVEGIVKLIEKENLKKPIVAGHFVQGVQLAVRMAVDHPDKTEALILMGGPAKFIAFMQGKAIDYPLERMILMVDKFTGPSWFKHMKKVYFDENNFGRSIYSLDSARGQFLRTIPETVSLPVIMRYSAEYFASDVKVEMQKIKCPVLVLRAMFNNEVLEDGTNSYLKPQFIDSWNNVPDINKLIKVVDIKSSGAFVWKDQPYEVYSIMKKFINDLK